MPERRKAVAHAVRHGISQRRACTLIGVARSALGYQSRLGMKDAPVIASMRELASQYPRYGYRRIRIFLRRQGLEMGPQRCHRLWTRAELQVPRKRCRRRPAGLRQRPLPSASANHVWAYDFVFDACANGQQLKCLTIVDEFTRECLAIDVAGSIRSSRVIEILSRLISIHGTPGYIRSDNGPEFVSKAILEWIIGSGIHIAHIDPGKPWQNGTDESFNGKFRDECLSAEWFRSREEARVIIESWRRHYNAVRPHSSLDYLTPNEYKVRLKLYTHQGARL